MINISEQERAFNAEFYFKGKKLEPFSQKRFRAASSIGVRFTSNPPPGIGDMHAIIYLCLCSKDEISESHYNPKLMWENIDEWAEKNTTPSDWKEEGEIVKAILEAAFATKAEPIPDDDSLTDELGN